MLRLLVVDCPAGTYPLYVGLNKGGEEVAYVDSVTHGPHSTARTATPDDVTAAFLAQCEAEGKGKELREGPRGQMWALPGHDGPQVLRWLNLSALLEPEAGSEQGKPPDLEAEVLRQTAREDG